MYDANTRGYEKEKKKASKRSNPFLISSSPIILIIVFLLLTVFPVPCLCVKSSEAPAPGTACPSGGFQ
jgi:hypothetical protein